MTVYLRSLLDQGRVTHDEYQALLPSGAQSPEELYALTLHFPTLFARVLPGGNLAKVSALAAQHTSQAFRGVALANAAAPMVFAKGAEPPANVPFPIGASVGFQAAVPHAPAAPGRSRIDHHTAARNAGWPVRNQGQRGTCVAHAMAACREQIATSQSPGPSVDQSEQYLYWGAKQLDPSLADGTLHSHALAAMQQHGMCVEALWPYVGQAVAGPVHQGPPPSAAQRAAHGSLHQGGGVTSASSALALYTQLALGPVAIGVPVFADPVNVRLDNWNVGGLIDYGRVAEPPPMSVVVGGHAVCVVGFEPDANEPAGEGWFIIRNSWGTTFGSQLPNTGYKAPEPGYGQISWSYVDAYLWEMCWLQ